MNFTHTKIILGFFFLAAFSQSCTKGYNLLEMTVSENRDYGYNQKNPIKLGGGLEQGVANTQKYFRLLVGANDEELKIERIGSCCVYTNFNAPNGHALMDMYRISHAGIEEPVIVYIDTYRSRGTPKIPVGFKMKKIQAEENKK